MPSEACCACRVATESQSPEAVAGIFTGNHTIEASTARKSSGSSRCALGSALRAHSSCKAPRRLAKIGSALSCWHLHCKNCALRGCLSSFAAQSLRAICASSPQNVPFHVAVRFLSK